MDFLKAREYIIPRLKKELDPRLTYHGVHHTLDVLDSVIRIGQSEGIDADELVLLKTAALFHDSGFLKIYKGHEYVSCELARNFLPSCDFSQYQISRIEEMIMATMIPQNPKSLLGEILCDADLDYLGRDDFYKIGNTLYKELIAYNVLQTRKEWNLLQISFLEKHSYFTKTNILTREPKKREFIEKVKKMVTAY